MALSTVPGIQEASTHVYQQHYGHHYFICAMLHKINSILNPLVSIKIKEYFNLRNSGVGDMSSLSGIHNPYEHRGIVKGINKVGKKIFK